MNSGTHFKKVTKSQLLRALFSTGFAFGTGLCLFLSPSQAQTTLYSPRLAEWLALTGPNGLHLPAGRYASFLKITPQWPLRSRITWRYEQALQQETSPATLQKLCPLFPLTQLSTLLHCSAYLSDSASQARLLWRNGLSDTQSEQKLLTTFGQFLSQEDQWNRYQTLEKKGAKQAALRQKNRLLPPQRDLAEARFAQKFMSPDADQFSLSQTLLTSGPDLPRLRLHLLRQQNRIEEGYTFWQQNSATFSHYLSDRPFAQEIIAYARYFLQSARQSETQRESDGQKALALLTSFTQTPGKSLSHDALFLQGTITLTLFNEPEKAEGFFLELIREPGLTDQARGLYWLGRCAEAQNKNEDAQSRFTQAASFPTVFYGQLALAHLTQSPFFDFTHRTPAFTATLKEKLTHLPLPEGGPIPRRDLAEAAQSLARNGDSTNATIFVTYLYAHTEGSPALISVAKLSARLGIPKGAILSAHKLGRNGIMLYPTGYPIPYETSSLSELQPPLPDFLLASLIRQESSGDPEAISPSPAYGLMQLRLPTAQMMARKHHLGSITPPMLLDPQTNMLLGSFYLSELLKRFNGFLPYTLAAYNAGPARVKPVDPTALSTENDEALLAWIIQFPFKETRTYIQHIISDMAIYGTLSP